MNGAPTVEVLGARLWFRGDRTLLERHPRIAVVGTRTPTEAGARRARKLVRDLVQSNANTVIVSGLARGIDTLAHTEALARGGRTIAVIGTPIDRVYPKENAELQRRIGDSELLLSEFAPGAPITRSSFPRRNRTMALVADASVIVEAGATSGAESHGWAALRLGRPLFLLKSLADSPHAWPRRMQTHGARVLRDVAELLEVLSSPSRETTQTRLDGVD